MRLIFTCLFVSFMISLHAQIQDSFNLCVGYETNEDYTYLIPNPDFEEFTCCPSSYSQMNCVNNWTQPSTPTSDFMHTCDFIFRAAIAADLVPFPSGEGIVGTIFAAGWQEYISVCLNEPILAGEHLLLKFKIAYTGIDNFGDECNATPHSPIDIVVYGHNDCGSMALPTNGCPLGVDPDWTILGSSNYQPLAEWHEFIIEINTIEDVNAIIIGSPCSLPPDYTLQGCIAYFYYDDFSLVGDIVIDKEILASEIGHPCSNDYSIIAEIDTFGGEWQWYLDGEILSSEMNPTLNISSKNLASGLYSVRYIIGDYCVLYQKQVNLDEMQLIHWEANLIHDDGSGNGSVDIIIEDERPPYQISWAHGADMFTLSDLEPGEYYATVTDAVGCSITIEVTVILSNYTKNPIVTLWNTEMTGISSNNQISIPGMGTNYSIYWEEIDHPENRDSTIGNNTTLITFPNPGIYSVSITPGDGTFHQIKFNGEGDKSKILNIIQWGAIEWSSFSRAFKGCVNLKCESSDLPILTNVTDMGSMFSECTKLNGPDNIGFWDVSNVTHMDNLFSLSMSFNQDIGAWNVANVVDMSMMFFEAYSFNQDIGAWNVANVVDMSMMFSEAYSFNQNIGNWDVSNVTNVGWMFKNAISFNQNIGRWDVSNVTDMGSMFFGARSFNQDIGSWKVDSVTDMRFMFSGASSFNKPIANWNTSKVIYMQSMFSFASSFNQEIGDWDVSNVINMGNMFEYASSFDKKIRNWNVTKVTSMSSMFTDASSFNQDIGQWNVGNVTDMRYMFETASLFNQDIGNWNVANVYDMRGMFLGASSFNQEIGSWDVANVTFIEFMFANAVSFNGNIGEWDVANVIFMDGMFWGARSFNQNIGTWNIIKVNDMRSMLNESGMGCDNYSATIIGWNSLPTTPNGRILGAEGLEYGTEAEAARNNLISSKGWTIEGDSPSDVECPLSVNTEATEINSTLKLFPNPFGNNLIVQFSGVEKVTIVLYDQLSRKVVQRSFSNSTTIDTEHFPQGLYLYEIKKNHQIISSGKIVKQ